MVIGKYSGELSSDKSDQYFKTIKQQLYYTGNNAKFCLTDKLDLETQKEKGGNWVKTEFTSFMLSLDKTKILFGALVGWGDLPHGPYSIVNADGSKQMMLKKLILSAARNL